MTITLHGTNAKAIDDLQKLVQTWIFPNISESQRALVMQHIKWMREQKSDLHVNCRIELQETKHVTRVVIEASFDELHPWKQ